MLLTVSVLGGGLLAAQTYSTPLPTVSDKDVALLRQNLQAADEADNMTRLLALADEEIINLRLQYLPKFEQVPPGTKAALFMQLDRRLDSSSMCRFLRSSQPSNHSNQGQLQPCR